MISDYLSPAERLECMKAGALAYAGALDSAEKTAAAGSGSGAGPIAAAAGAATGAVSKLMPALSAGKDTIDKSVLLMATLLGIPAGIAMHSIGHSVEDKRFDEERIRHKINLYRDFAEDMRRGVGA